MGSTFFFTSRIGGVSQPPYDSRNLALHVGESEDLVSRNRAGLAKEIGVDRGNLFFMNQVHGVAIVEITDQSQADEIRECDALITRTSGVALAVLVADCAPVILIGEETCAVIHVGWRGLFAGIIENVVSHFNGEKFSALIGPTICGNCYEIGDDLHKRASERNFQLGDKTLDIPNSILQLLQENAGRQLISAEWNGICTFESREHFSYRRDNVTGRQAGVVINGS